MIREQHEHLIDHGRVDLVHAERSCRDPRDAARPERAGHGAVAAGALRWGEPVLDSAVTAITPRGPAYRGRLAVELAAEGQPFENVAELLWSGYLPPGAVTWPRSAMPHAQLARLIGTEASPLDVMPLLVQVAALADPERDDRRPDAFVTRGRRLIPLLAAALAPGFGAATVTRARIPSHPQALQIPEGVQAWSPLLAGDAAHLAPADVGIQRSHLDPEVLRRGPRIDPTLIVDSTLINHNDDPTRSIER